MRDDTYGISIIGLATGLYGIFALFHAIEFRASAPVAQPETVAITVATIAER